MTEEPKIVAPEGVEFQINIFLTSDSTGLDICTSLKGFTSLGQIPFVKCDELAKSVSLYDVADDWRCMTRDEIRQYKDGEGDDDED